MELVLELRNRPSRPREREQGFSLIEVLIAAGLMLVIAVGIIPLFTRSMVNTIGGAESTTVSNFGKTRLEEMLQLPIDDASLIVPAGMTELVVEEYWSFATESWVPGAAPAPGDPGPWTRKTVVKQFAIDDLDDGTPTFDNPIPGGNNLNDHLREITVTIASTRQGGPLSKGKELTLTVLKAK